MGPAWCYIMETAHLRPYIATDWYCSPYLDPCSISQHHPGKIKVLKHFFYLVRPWASPVPVSLCTFAAPPAPILLSVEG